MIITDNGKYKTIINLDARNINSLSLISYANDFSKMLHFTEEERHKMINAMIISVDFEAILAIFKHYFDEQTIIYYQHKQI